MWSSSPTFVKCFHQLCPMGRFGLVVTESVCLSVCLSPFHAIFFEASRWSSDKSRNLFKLVLVLLSAAVERVSVSRMWDFLKSNVYFSLSLPDRMIVFFEIWSRNSLKHCLLLLAFITLILCKIIYFDCLFPYLNIWICPVLTCPYLTKNMCQTIIFFFNSQLLIWGERSWSEYNIIFLRGKEVALKILQCLGLVFSMSLPDRKKQVKQLTCFVYFNKICLQCISNSLNLSYNLFFML